MLCEENKQSRTSIEYWFKVVDIKGDGIITPDEMKFFYEEHISRLEYSPHESIPFSDILLQLMDMLKIEDLTIIRLNDLLERPASAAVFYNALLNLNKFLNYEQRDPFVSKSEEQKYCEYNDWDLYAMVEYLRLSEEGEEDENNVLDDQMCEENEQYEDENIKIG